jgi:hypothetical protein
VCGLAQASLRDLHFGAGPTRSRFRCVLSADHAIELADRRQRRALREAAGFAAVLGEPVGFLRRAVPGGAVFEAVALRSARTCAIVDEHGALRLAPAPASSEPWDRANAPTPVPRFSAAARRAAERTLTAAARPAAAE